ARDRNQFVRGLQGTRDQERALEQAVARRTVRLRAPHDPGTSVRRRGRQNGIPRRSQNRRADAHSGNRQSQRRLHAVRRRGQKIVFLPGADREGPDAVLTRMTHRSDVARWKRSLKHVRFCEAAPRQGEDREIFEIDIEIPEAEPAFLELLSSLGIELRRIQPEDTVARTGTSYTPQEWKKLTFPIPQFPQFAQPGDT